MPGPAPDNTHPPPPRSQNFGVGVLVAITLLGLALLIALNPNGFEPKTVRIPYSPTFLEQVRAGNVSAISSKSATVSGTFRTPVRYPSDATTPASAFVTVIPEFANSSALMALLQSKGVEISATAPSTGTSPLLTLLLFFGPVVLIVLLFVWLRRSGGVGGAAAFGRSRAQRVEPSGHTVDFDDVAGIDEAKAELTELVDFLKDPDKYRRLGGRIPRGVLLTGPPGTGKTLLARALAGEARVPFFSISASEFVEMFVGVGASRVRDLFKQAKEAAPAIVFVDELDAIGRSRAGAMGGFGGGHDEREQTLNQILTEMDGFDPSVGVIVIAATNRPDVLDQALLRPGRFDRQVTLGYPDRAGREAILRIHTRELPLASDVDLAAIARAAAGFSGADLANLANEAALLAARASKTTVGMTEFEEAIDKILLGTKQADLADPTERRTVAYHEGGHTLVALLTPGADPVQKVTIVPHGRALGVTEQRPDDDRRNYTRDYLLARLAVMLGGRAAEEVVFGQPTTGAENDLKQAASLARRMAGLWGMSDDLGAVAYGVGETYQYLGQEVPTAREYAESTASRIDAAVTRLVEDAHASAVQLLRTHRTTLDAIAAELVDKEIVTGVRLAEMLADTTGRDVAPAESGIKADSGPAATTEAPAAA